MSTTPNPTPAAAWLDDLRARDRVVHEDLHADASTVEVQALRTRNAELAAALVQAENGIRVRDALLVEVDRRLETHEVEVEALTAQVREARAERDAATAQLTEVLGSLRWRAGDVAAGALRGPRRLAATVRRRVR